MHRGGPVRHSRVSSTASSLSAAGLVVLMAGAFLLDGISGARGVTALNPTESPLLEEVGVRADYEETYGVVVSAQEFRTIEALISRAYRLGREVGRTPVDVAYTDSAPGLRVAVAYNLRRGVSRHVVTMTTRVQYENWLGRAYFSLVRPIQQRVVPFLMSRWSASGSRIWAALP